jgi:alpha-ribazole phosphatase/probable phosphoglycerate mutase
MTHFCLIRHGQTDWNLEGRYQGQSDVPLNEKGHAQAKALADQLCKYVFAAIFSSDLSRARQTAGSIAGVLGLTVQLDPRLREIGLGEWEGILVTDIKEHYEQLWEQRLVDPANSRPPGGETVSEVATRMYAALDGISRLYPAENVLIASHGLSIATVICRAQNIPIGQAYTVVPENVQPIWVEWEPG